MKNIHIQISPKSSTTQSLSFDVPCYWSINKLKCLYVNQIPALKFDNFQISYHDQLLEGKYILQSLHSQQQWQMHDYSVKLQVIAMASKISLQEYYNSTMNKIFRGNINNHLPLMNAQLDNSENDNHRQIEQDDDDPNVIIIDIFVIWNSIKVLGIYGFLLILVGHGNLLHYGAVCLATIAYLGLQIYKKYRKRQQIFEYYLKQLQNKDDRKLKQKPYWVKRRISQRKLVTQNNDVRNFVQFLAKMSDNLPQNTRKIMGYCLMGTFMVLQALFCFIMTVFPNWGVKDHLTLCFRLVVDARCLVNMLIPGTYNKIIKQHIFKRQT